MYDSTVSMEIAMHGILNHMQHADSAIRHRWTCVNEQCLNQFLSMNDQLLGDGMCFDQLQDHWVWVEETGAGQSTPISQANPRGPA